MASLGEQRAEFLGLELKALSDVWTDDGVEASPSEAEIEFSKAISAKRQADALEIIAKRLDHLTDYFDADKAQLRVRANCDVRQG